MSSPTSPSQLRALYRALLRELPPRPILSRHQSPLYRSLRASFAKPTPAPAPFSPSESSQTQPFVPANIDVSLAEQLLGYLRSQRTYVGLIERYNPGMGMDQEERIRLTARRVGMNLPVEFDQGRL